MRALMLVGGGILIGVGLSYGDATIRAERASRERFDEELASHKRVLERAAEDFLWKQQSEAPVETEEDLDGPDTGEDAVKVGGEMVQQTALSDVTPSADYLAAARDYTEALTVGDPTIPVQYISEDEFGEEDGRAKEQILIHMGEGEPLFINEGLVIQDWQSLISPNILVDMYSLCPPGTDKILYVRNHRNDTDYEVIQEIP